MLKSLAPVFIRLSTKIDISNLNRQFLTELYPNKDIILEISEK